MTPPCNMSCLCTPFSCRSLGNVAGPPGRVFPPHSWPVSCSTVASSLRLAWKKLPGVLEALGGSLVLFEHFFRWKDHTFWLDRSVLGLWRCVCVGPVFCYAICYAWLSAMHGHGMWHSKVGGRGGKPCSAYLVIPKEMRAWYYNMAHGLPDPLGVQLDMHYHLQVHHLSGSTSQTTVYVMFWHHKLATQFYFVRAKGSWNYAVRCMAMCGW